MLHTYSYVLSILTTGRKKVSMFIDILFGFDSNYVSIHILLDTFCMAEDIRHANNVQQHTEVAL